MAAVADEGKLVSVADDGTEYLNDKFESAPRTNNYRDYADEQSNVVIE